MPVDLAKAHAEIISDVLNDRGIGDTDGRPLHDYAPSSEQLMSMTRMLRLRVQLADDSRRTGEIFTLWASERIRREFRGGPLTWRFLFDGLGVPENQDLARALTATGMKGWKRTIRRSERGAMYLYSLLAEGGLPDALIAEAGRFRDEISGIVGEIEAEGALSLDPATQIVERRVRSFPLVFQTDETQRLLAELALALIELRRRLPKDVDEQCLDEELERLSDWRGLLPLRLSAKALRELIAPALLAGMPATRNVRGGLSLRLLRKSADGAGWAGALLLNDQGLLPLERLPEECREKRLRLLPSDALAAAREAFLAVPEVDGWRLSRNGRRGAALFALAPWTPAIFTAHVDGRRVAEAIIDGGIDAPEDNPSFWKASQTVSGALEYLGPVGSVRGEEVWLLAPKGVAPVALEGVAILGTEAGPQGELWRLSGHGRIQVGAALLTVKTGAETDSKPMLLIPTGLPLRGWHALEGWPTIIGTPRFFGGEVDGGMHSVQVRTLLRAKNKRVLFGETTSWVKDGGVQARTRTIELPENFAARLTPSPNKGADLAISGLSAGLIVSLTAGSTKTQETISEQGDAHLRLEAPGDLPSHALLRIYNANDGRFLILEAPWPGREAVFITPGQTRLTREQSVAIGSLPGWRGLFPEGGGVLQIRPEGGGDCVAIPSDGEISLSAQEPLLRSVLAQTGPDRELRLRLVAGGRDSVRLKVGRHEWAPRLERDLLELGPAKVALHALTLDGTRDVLEICAEASVDLRAALGEGGGIWFVQGLCALRGVMRPIAWSASPKPKTTREARIAVYAAGFEEMLHEPTDPRWRELQRLLSNARAGGEVSALDQVQAFARKPAAAVALLFRTGVADLADAMAIEDACAIWWPTSLATDWGAGVRCDIARRTRMNIDLDEDVTSAKQNAQFSVARRAHDILALRPELRTHLALAFEAAGMQPFAFDAEEKALPMRLGAPEKAFDDLAAELARRAPEVLQGAGGLPEARASRAERFSPQLRPFLDAPMVAAEIALGLRPKADMTLALRLMALRIGDPLWFDAALPAAMQILRTSA